MTLFLFVRIVHILLGTFWAGTIIFAAAFLIPSMRDAGPAGGKVLASLHRRGYFTAMPIIAILTLLAGFWLYMKLMTAGGPEFAAAWRATRTSMAYNFGAVAGLLAFLLGALWLRPASLALVHLGEKLAATAPGAEHDAIQAELTRNRARSGSAIRWVALLLLIATVTMAVARYL